MAEFMGTEIGGEIDEAFYTHSEFLVDHVDDLYPFLTNGPLDMPDLARPMDSIRHLTIAISFKTYTTDNAGGTIMQSEEATKSDFQQKILPLANIANMKHVNRLKLEIRVRTYLEISAKKFEEVLYLLVYDLKDKGAEIKVSCEPYTYFFYPERFETFDCNFDGPRSDWDEKVRKNSAFGKAALVSTSYP
jgi:hypothetical protein